jgi:hypothetical protein
LDEEEAYKFVDLLESALAAETKQLIVDSPRIYRFNRSLTWTVRPGKENCGHLDKAINDVIRREKVLIKGKRCWATTENDPQTDLFYKTLGAAAGCLREWLSEVAPGHGHDVRITWNAGGLIKICKYVVGRLEGETFKWNSQGVAAACGVGAGSVAELSARSGWS